MRKKLLVPYGVGEPPDGVEAMLPPDVGRVLDTGLTWTDTGEGLLVVTTMGVLAVDPESGDMAGIRWEHFDPPLQLNDHGTHATLTFVVQGCGAISFGIEREFAGNIWALAYQFRDLDDGDLDDGVILVDRALIDGAGDDGGGPVEATEVGAEQERPTEVPSLPPDSPGTVRLADGFPPLPSDLPPSDLPPSDPPPSDLAGQGWRRPQRPRRRWLGVGL